MFPMTDSLAITQMPQIGWIDALRRYNLGGSSWCIPRRGTPEYDKVMMIRQGAEDVKPQPRRRTVKARLPEEKPEPEPEAEVVVPTVKMDEPEPSKTNQESLKKMSGTESKGMDRIYFYKDKLEYTIWELDGDTFTQLADWNSVDGARGKAGFVPTMARTRKTDDGGRSYLTPGAGKNKVVQPLPELPTAPVRLQREVVAGLEALGYTKNIEFEDEAKGEDAGAGGEFVAQPPKVRKAKRVDSPEVVALLEKKAKIEADKVELVRRRDANEIPSDKAYFKAVETFMKDTTETEKEIRKARLAQTKQAKAEVVVPTVKVDRTADIEKQIETELDAGEVSVSYDLGWKPETTEKVQSGADRAGQAMDYKYLMRLDSVPTTLDTAVLNKIIDDPKEDKSRREFAKDLLNDIVMWKPKNVYSSRSAVYNTKTKTGGTNETNPALEDYQQFADKVNEIRGTPIRTITYNTQFEMNGSRTLMAYWTITRRFYDEVKNAEYVKEYRHFVRQYQLTPEFKFLGGATIKDVEKEVEEERKKAEMQTEKQKATAEKKKTKQEEVEAKKQEEQAFEEKFEADPRVKDLNKKLEALQGKMDEILEKSATLSKAERKEERKKEKDKADIIVKQREDVRKQLAKIRKEMKK